MVLAKVKWNKLPPNLPLLRENRKNELCHGGNTTNTNAACTYLESCTERNWQGAVGVTCVGGGRGLPRAGYSRFQPALQRAALTHRMTKWTSRRSRRRGQEVAWEGAQRGTQEETCRCMWGHTEGLHRGEVPKGVRPWRNHTETTGNTGRVGWGKERKPVGPVASHTSPRPASLVGLRLRRDRSEGSRDQEGEEGTAGRWGRWRGRNGLFPTCWRFCLLLFCKSWLSNEMFVLTCN